MEVIAIVIAAIAAFFGFGEWQRRRGQKQVKQEVESQTLKHHAEFLQRRLQTEREGREEAERIASEVADEVARVELETATRLDNISGEEAVAFIERARQLAKSRGGTGGSDENP